MKDYEYNGKSEHFAIIAKHTDMSQDNTRIHFEWVDKWQASLNARREDYDARRENVLQMLKSTNFTIEHKDKQLITISWRYPRGEYVFETKGYLLNLASERVVN
jgi:hypothetical protein